MADSSLFRAGRSASAQIDRRLRTDPTNRRRITRLTYVFVICLVAACAKATALPPTASPAAAAAAHPGRPSGHRCPSRQYGAVGHCQESELLQPIALSDDDSTLVVANPLDGSLSLLNVAGDANAKLAEIKTGDQPRTVAIRPDKPFAHVANQGSASVSVVDLTSLKKVVDVAVGSEPYGVAVTPDGSLAFAADAAGDAVAVIDTASHTVVKVILMPGVQPRGIAITHNNAGQGPQLIFVTQFLSQPTASGGPGLDQGSQGKVFMISTADLSKVQDVISLAAHDTGFGADRTAFGGTLTDATVAYPNQLQSVVLKDGHTYLPNVAASHDGPVKFNVDTQAFLSVYEHLAAPCRKSFFTHPRSGAVLALPGRPGPI
jgi:YVTN family beta-propeller protein